MSDGAVARGGKLRGQPDHHHHGQAAPRLAARDDVVVGRARLALIIASAGELAGKARQREQAAGRPVIGEGALADLLAARVFDRELDRTIARSGAMFGESFKRVFRSSR
jgi:hypothetical protein